MRNQERTALGNYLKSLREARTLSLRDVEGRTGISNAFLSQIESGKVKQPSPVMLYKMAGLYDIPYEALMELVGYPVSSSPSKAPRAASAVFNRLGNISEEEEQELLDYLVFLRSRMKREGGKK